MKPAAFEYHRPATLEAALQLLAAHGDDAKPLAGGQSLVPMMNMRLAQPKHLVDLGAIEPLRSIRVTPETIEIGAGVVHHDAATHPAVRERLPLVAAGAATIGHYAIRTRGTIGGSLAHADPAAQWPLLAITTQAAIEVASPRGTRTIPAREMFLGIMTTALASDEIIVAVRFPAMTPAVGWSFRHFNRRHGDFAIVAVACELAIDGGMLASIRLGVGGAGPVPTAFDAALDEFTGRPLDAAAVAARVATLVEPEQHPSIPVEYRRELTETLTRRALAEAAARALSTHP